MKKYLAWKRSEILDQSYESTTFHPAIASSPPPATHPTAFLFQDLNFDHSSPAAFVDSSLLFSGPAAATANPPYPHQSASIEQLLPLLQAKHTSESAAAEEAARAVHLQFLASRTLENPDNPPPPTTIGTNNHQQTLNDCFSNALAAAATVTVDQQNDFQAIDQQMGLQRQPKALESFISAALAAAAATTNSPSTVNECSGQGALLFSPHGSSTNMTTMVDGVENNSHQKVNNHHHHALSSDQPIHNNNNNNSSNPSSQQQAAAEAAFLCSSRPSTAEHLLYASPSSSGNASFSVQPTLTQPITVSPSQQSSQPQQSSSSSLLSVMAAAVAAQSINAAAASNAAAALLSQANHRLEQSPSSLALLNHQQQHSPNSATQQLLTQALLQQQQQPPISPANQQQNNNGSSNSQISVVNTTAAAAAAACNSFLTGAAQAPNSAFQVDAYIVKKKDI